ncbi:MAG: hypothetical protein LBL21_03275 [Rickettsiales bacterium]|nr:hypothetical protein [Rickettsiales bacterium]
MRKLFFIKIKFLICALALIPCFAMAYDNIDGVMLANSDAGMDRADDIMLNGGLRVGKVDRQNADKWKTLAIIYTRLCELLGVKADWSVQNDLWSGNGYNLGTGRSLAALRDLIAEVRKLRDIVDKMCDDNKSKLQIEECPIGAGIPTGNMQNGASSVYKCLRTPNGRLYTYDSSRRALVQVDPKYDRAVFDDYVLEYSFVKYIVHAKETAVGYRPVSPDEARCVPGRQLLALPSGTEYTGSYNLRAYLDIIYNMNEQAKISNDSGYKNSVDLACRKLVALATEIRYNYNGVGLEMKDAWRTQTSSIVGEIQALMERK